MTSRPFALSALAVLLASLVLTGCAAAGSGASKRAIARQAASAEAELEKRVRTVAHYATGLSYELNDKSQQALDEMVRAAEMDPTFEPIVIEAARRCIRAQDTGKAIELLTEASAAPHASGAIYAWLGLAYAHAGKTDLAVAANRTAISKMPQSLAAYQNLAQIYLQNSRTNEALRVLEEAAQQPTDDPGFLLDVAELYLRYSRTQAATAETIKKRVLQILDRASDLAPTDPGQVLRLADTYFVFGELAKAEPFYRQLLQEHPDLQSVRARLADIYLRSGNKQKAAQQLEALAHSDPTNTQAYLYLGALAAEQEKYAEAAEHFERALKLDPNLEQVYYELAGLKITLNKSAEALELLENARARFKRNFSLEFYTGIAYAAAKNYSEALKYLTSAEAIARATDPGRLNHGFYFQVGSAQERAGNLEEAEKYFREALKLDPDDPETLNYLGYMWAEKGIKLGEARDLIEKAVKLQPDNAAFLDSLAWVLFKSGKPAEALPPMLKAIQHTKKPDATLYDHLGDIYSALGQVEAAREAWNKAVKLEPNQQVEQKLKAPSALGRSSK